MQEDGSGASAAAAADAARGSVARPPRRCRRGAARRRCASATRSCSSSGRGAARRARRRPVTSRWTSCSRSTARSWSCRPTREDRPLRRVLVAVEGDGESTALRRLFEQLGDRATPEVIALHVIEPSDVPAVRRQPGARGRGVRARVHDPGLRARVVADPSRVRFEMRVGDARRRAARGRARSSTSISSCWRGTGSSSEGTVGSCARCSPERRCPVVLLPLDRRRSPPERRHLSVQLAADSCSAAYTCSHRGCARGSRGTLPARPAARSPADVPAAIAVAAEEVHRLHHLLDDRRRGGPNRTRAPSERDSAIGCSNRGSFIRSASMLRCSFRCPRPYGPPAGDG